MNCLSVEYNLKTKSLDVYLAGCNGNPKCTGCHNPESWSFDNGFHITKAMTSIEKYIQEFDVLIKNIMIFGGEPLDQDRDKLQDFLFFLNNYNKKIWLFTRYELSEIPIAIFNLCDYIKTGRYLPELKCDDNVQFGVKLATSNQSIYKTGSKYE